MDERTLRTLMVAVETGITRTTQLAVTPDDKKALTHAWEALVQHLALGPAPETRGCPGCGREVRLAATVCGYCWSKLAPAVAP